MLRGFCDASGQSDDPKDLFVTLGGVVSDLDSWEKFELLWGQMLRDFEVSELHMADLNQLIGEYTGWDVPKREKFLGCALKIMDTHCAGYIGASMPVEVFQDLTDEHQRKLVDPYFPCFFVNISGLMTCADHLSADEKVEMVLDDDTGMKGKAENFWEKTKVEGPAEVRERLGTITAGACSRYVFPLQAADLVAHEINRFNTSEYLHEKDGTPFPKNWPRWPFKQLFDSGKLLTYDLLNRRNSKKWFGVSFRSSFLKPGP